MRLNGGRYEGGSLSSTSTTEADDMIETENESVRERVSDLEKKVLEQGDEIVCLRSTLADVLRRLNQLEGTRPVTTTPLKNGALRGINHSVGNHASSPGNKEALRYRPVNDTNNRDNVRRVASYTNPPSTPSSLPQRPIHKGFASCRNISRIEEELPAMRRPMRNSFSGDPYHMSSRIKEEDYSSAKRQMRNSFSGDPYHVNRRVKEEEEFSSAKRPIRQSFSRASSFEPKRFQEDNSLNTRQMRNSFSGDPYHVNHRVKEEKEFSSAKRPMRNSFSGDPRLVTRKEDYSSAKRPLRKSFSGTSGYEANRNQEDISLSRRPIWKSFTAVNQDALQTQEVHSILKRPIRRSLSSMHHSDSGIEEDNSILRRPLRKSLSFVSDYQANGLQNGRPSLLRRPLRKSLSTGSHHNINEIQEDQRSLLRRRVVHYQSTGSLHSDSPSSSSVSPVPTSPSPSPTRPTAKTPTPTSSSGNLSLSKRWSSTGDFNSVSSPNHNSRLSTKSLFNLYMRPNPTQNHTPQLKHGTRDALYNEEEGTLRMYLRGRPVILYAPTPLADNYDITKVATAPHSKLKLDWVYGYRGRDCRSNLYLLPTGEMVYFVAAVVVLYNVEEQSQRHYLGHNDDIKCIAIHPNKLLVATGQAAGHDTREGRSHIRVWNSVNLNTVCVIGIGEFEKSISCLSFSKADGGALLCAVDEANDHNISIWDWQKGDKGYKVTETKCSVDTVVAAEFHPLDRNCIVTCGKSHISFWSLDAGGTLYKRMGIFENRDKPKYVTCLAFTQTGDVLSGDSNGNIIVWGRGTNTIARLVRNVHEGSVFTICVLKEGSVVTGGGKDGRLIQFDHNLEPTGFEAQIAEHLGGVRTLSEGRGSQLLVGSTRNCILVGSLNMGFSPAVLGHTDELWALAAHPSLSQFLTAGFDKIVQLWDSMARSVVWSKDIAEQAQSASFSPDGSVIVIGCVLGRWLVMDSETREVYSVHTDGAEPIQVVKYSPDARLLALGSRDNNIYIYQVGEDMRKYSRVGRCTAERKRRRSTTSLISILGHSSFITHLDWSEDSQYLRSNSGDYEILYWNPSLCRQVPQSASLRDVEWASQSCTLSFSTIGIWPESADGTDVNSCERSHDSRLLATADDFGKVKLYSYPVTQPKSLCHTYGGHSSHVTNVTFLYDDSRLISIGGKDTSVLQWRIT